VSESLLKRVGSSPDAEDGDGFMHPEAVRTEHAFPISVRSVVGSAPTGPS